MIILGLDIGSNSVGSSWFDTSSGLLATATSVFPAGVEESDEKRGDPKNVKRRMTRHMRVNLARRAERKRALRLKLINAGLLPAGAAAFHELLARSDPLDLRRRGLTESLDPHDFGRVLLHLAQRRGALGINADAADGGKVKKAVTHLQLEMLGRYGSDDSKEVGRSLRERIYHLAKAKRRSNEENLELDSASDRLKELCRALLQNEGITVGRLMADLRDERQHILSDKDGNPKTGEKGNPAQYSDPVRNRRDSFEFHADRSMLRDEFSKLWDAQKRIGGSITAMLTNDLRRELDDESRQGIWRHAGLLFGQRKTYWDTGILGRCDLEPTERCVPHADMYASRYLVVETLNNLRIVERGEEARSLTPEERNKLKLYLTGPLGVHEKGKQKGQPKRSVSVTDLRDQMGPGWGRAGKTSHFYFNIESDEEREINTDWFSREIIHGAVTLEKWKSVSLRVREGINRAILRYDTDDDANGARLKSLLMEDWAALNELQAEAVVAAWKRRPRPDANRLKMSRRAVRNLLVLMDRPEPWPDPKRPGELRWLTQIEARKLIAEDAEFKDQTTGGPLDDMARSRYARGAKGATARDRHYMRKHLLRRDGEVVCGPDGVALHEPAPVPFLSNPVVRRAIHEVRRHLIEYIVAFERKPDQVYIELSREANMGKKDADELLFRNRLRNRIRKDITNVFELDSGSSTQRRVAEDRVILATQQRCVCPLCGKTRRDDEGISPRTAAYGHGCQIAHIIPRGSGGHNGFGNIVLAHSKCNQDMRRRTPREYWDAVLKGGFEEGVRWIEGIYAEIQRPKPSEIKGATGEALWSCYFAGRPRRFGPTFDELKIAQFKKDIKDIQQMTNRQDAATKYAARQTMAYLADALYDGNGLPERSGERKIFSTDGIWTGRLRREWGLFFDPHKSRAHGLSGGEEHGRKEKNRGDHRHHAVDAVATAFCSENMRNQWEDREKRADREGVNTADEVAMESYRRLHRLPPPAPFVSREAFQEAVRRAVFGDGGIERPICHRAVKRKLIGYLHKATQYGPVIDTWKQGGEVNRELVEGRATVRQDILGDAPSDFLKPMQLRLPRPETDEEAVERLARRLRIGKRGLPSREAIKLARKLVRSKAFTRANIDPKPEKGGIVRDIGLRRILRKRLEERGLNPDEYTKSELKKSIDEHGPLTMGPLVNDRGTGVPIQRVVLLWAINDPVTIRRNEFDHSTGERRKMNALNTLRLYDSQNNHHIEIRAKKDKKGNEVWSGKIITAFEVSRRLLDRLRKLRPLERPFRHLRKKLTAEQRQGLSTEEVDGLARRRASEWREAFRKIKRQRKEIIDAHPLVDRSDSEGGAFVMSLSEGEMLKMRRKCKNREAGDVGYFVVAKLEKDSIVVVPHWDARAATERKDSEGRKVPDSSREQFPVTPTDLKDLAPPDRPHAVKIRVSPLGKVTELLGD